MSVVALSDITERGGDAPPVRALSGRERARTSLAHGGFSPLDRNGSGVTARTSVALTGSGRAALERYTTVLRQLLDSASQPQARDVLPDARG